MQKSIGMKTMYVEKFEDLNKDDIGIAGGKGANLGELTQAKIPVPPGFVVTAEAYNKFMNDTGIFSKIMNILNGIDVNETKGLQEAAEKIKRIIIGTDIPEDIIALITEAYNELCQRIGNDDAYVAIRSSATAEDLPEASFAGQQDTFLNIKGNHDVINYVRKCWASLFEARAIFYREENNFEHSKVYIAVVVQEMVESEKAGVMFTVNPSTGENTSLIEGSWGLGEAVVSGSVTPDTYYVNNENNEILEVTISDKKVMFKKLANGDTKKVDVPKKFRTKRVLSEKELVELTEMGKRIQKHYNAPQDTEWAFHDNKLYMLQSRPITTLDEDSKIAESDDNQLEDRTVLVKGLGASPGITSGEVKIIHKIDELDKIKDGDIMVTAMTTPDMVPAMKRSNGIITDEGGVTCHAAIISRELGIPCVVGTTDATEVLTENSKVTIDGKKGLVFEGEFAVKDKKEEKTDLNVEAPIITVTEVKVNVSMAEAAEKASATGADGVGLLRTEHMMLTTGVHPKKFILDGKEDELIQILMENILKVVDVFYPKPVWYRTLDAPTDEFKTLDGGENEPYEHNPMLGWRGIRRELDDTDILKAEFKAIKKLHDQGYTNIGIMIPLSQSPDELKKSKELAEEIGLRPHKDVDFGIMVETPAAALTIEDFIDVGLDFISLGTNDLTQYTLAVDRNNELVAKNYSEEHPAVLKLIERTIIKCNEAGVKTSICGQAGSKPHIVEKLVEIGINSVSANTDAVVDVRHAVARAEQKLILDAARNQK